MGLQKRIPATVPSTQLVYPGGPGTTPTVNGDVLSLTAMEEIQLQVASPTHWFMNKTMVLKLTQAARTINASGYLSYTRDMFGELIVMYAGLPIVIFDEDNNKNQILPFTEEPPAGGTPQCTSIYLVSIQPMGLTGIHAMPSDEQLFDIEDLGQLETKPAFRTRIETEMGIAVKDLRSIGRIAGILNQPIVT